MEPASKSLDEATVETLRGGLRIIALRALGDPDAADEAVQETLVRGLAALRAGRLDDRAKLGAYFRGILNHVTTDFIRRRSRTTSLNPNHVLPVQSPPPDSLEALITEEEKARVARALEELPLRSQECLRLSFFEGLQPREIADRIGEPAARVRKRKSRAIAQLRLAFFQSYPDSDPGHDPETSSTSPKTTPAPAAEDDEGST